uniref:UPF0434 protein UBAL3_95680058a n=1 Tax=Leptospirillum ferrodiazotrophum TaxID=412449 RepID=C6I0G6_9BACT|nr:MAG: conserved protein of unknown function [Leptospirillum ferrodiazotrophum]
MLPDAGLYSRRPSCYSFLKIFRAGPGGSKPFESRPRSLHFHPLRRRSSVAIDPFLLSILVCPQCRGPLTLSEEPAGLVCASCRLLYPVKDDIPVMLVEEALPVAEGRP